MSWRDPLWKIWLGEFQLSMEIQTIFPPSEASDADPWTQSKGALSEPGRTHWVRQEGLCFQRFMARHQMRMSKTGVGHSRQESNAHQARRRDINRVPCRPDSSAAVRETKARGGIPSLNIKLWKREYPQSLLYRASNSISLLGDPLRISKICGRVRQDLRTGVQLTLLE